MSVVIYIYIFNKLHFYTAALRTGNCRAVYPALDSGLIIFWVLVTHSVIICSRGTMYALINIYGYGFFFLGM